MLKTRSFLEICASLFILFFATNSFAAPYLLFHPDKCDSTAVPGPSDTAPDPSYFGFSKSNANFMGWSCTGGTSGKTCDLITGNNIAEIFSRDGCDINETQNCSAVWICDFGYSLSESTCRCNETTYRITLSKNNGTGGTSTVYAKYKTGYSLTNFGTTVTSITVPTRTGYTFRGYYTSSSTVSSNSTAGTQRITKSGTLPSNTTFTANTVLYAGWAKDCTQPSNGSCSLSVTDNGAVTYTTSCNTGYTISGKGTATPTCTANGYTVTYKAGTGGSGSDVTQSVTYNTNFTTKAANTFTKANATFVDWYVADLDMSFPANYTLTYEIASDLTAVARWQCNAGYTLNSATGACAPCAAGTYKSSAGNGACTACTGNTVSSSGAKTCNVCDHDIHTLANESHTECVAHDCPIVYRSAAGITDGQLVAMVKSDTDFTTAPANTFSKPNATITGWHLANSPYTFDPQTTDIYSYECLEPGQGYTEFSAVWQCNAGYTQNADGNCDGVPIKIYWYAGSENEPSNIMKKDEELHYGDAITTPASAPSTIPTGKYFKGWVIKKES